MTTRYPKLDLAMEGFSECSQCGAIIAPQGQRAHSQLHSDFESLHSEIQLLKNEVARYKAVLSADSC